MKSFFTKLFQRPRASSTIAPHPEDGHCAGGMNGHGGSRERRDGGENMALHRPGDGGALSVATSGARHPQ